MITQPMSNINAVDRQAHISFQDSHELKNPVSLHQVTGIDGRAMRELIESVFLALAGLMALSVGSAIFFATAYATGSLATAAYIVGSLTIATFAIIGASSFIR